jgi:hypothetical protein
LDSSIGKEQIENISFNNDWTVRSLRSAGNASVYLQFTKEIKQEEDTQPAGSEHADSNAVATYNNEVVQQDGELHHLLLEIIVTLAIVTHILLRVSPAHPSFLTYQKCLKKSPIQSSSIRDMVVRCYYSLWQ